MKKNILFINILLLMTLNLFSSTLSPKFGERILRSILNPQTQGVICNLVKTLEIDKPDLYDDHKKWQGKDACGISAVVCSAFLENKGVINERIVVQNYYKNQDHSFLLAYLDGSKYIIDPTFRQFNLEDNGEKFLIKDSKDIKKWLKEESIDRGFIDPYWLCSREGIFQFYGSNEIYESIIVKPRLLSLILSGQLEEHAFLKPRIKKFRKDFIDAIYMHKIDSDQ